MQQWRHIPKITVQCMLCIGGLSLCLYHKLFHSSDLHRLPHLRPTMHISYWTSHLQQLSLIASLNIDIFSIAFALHYYFPSATVSIMCQSLFVEQVTA